MLNKIMKEWRLKNKDRIKKYSRKYYLERGKYYYKNMSQEKKDLKNKKQSEYNKIFFKDNPWIRVFRNVRERCKSQGIYGIRGRKCRITEEEVKFLWFRDKAYKLRRPSIDRIDNDGDYIINNCRFIELSENIKKGNIEYNKKVCIHGHKYTMKNTFFNSRGVRECCTCRLEWHKRRIIKQRVRRAKEKERKLI